MTRMSSGPRFSVMVCHDCCCGTDRKHPGVDHETVRQDLLGLDSATIRVRVVDCLDACGRSNVVLVRDHARPRRERDTWLAQIHDPAKVRAIATWVEDAHVPVPETLEEHVFEPDRPHD